MTAVSNNSTTYPHPFPLSAELVPARAGSRYSEDFIRATQPTDHLIEITRLCRDYHDHYRGDWLLHIAAQGYSAYLKNPADFRSFANAAVHYEESLKNTTLDKRAIGLFKDRLEARIRPTDEAAVEELRKYFGTPALSDEQIQRIKSLASQIIQPEDAEILRQAAANSDVFQSFEHELTAWYRTKGIGIPVTC